jgi:hypothetical protein
MTNSRFVRSLAYCCWIASAVAQAPPNDEPAGAFVVADGYNGLFSNVGATNSAGFAAVCGVGANSDVFFLYVASSSGNHVFSTCTPSTETGGTLTDSIVNVYSVASPMASLACDDDTCGNPPRGSLVAVNLAAGGSYYVRVSRYGANADGSFHLTAVPPAASPAADACVAAPPLGLGYAQLAMSGATPSSPSAACSAFTGSNPDVWATFAAPASGTIVLHRENQIISRFAAYAGTCGAEVPLSGANVCVNAPGAPGNVAKWSVTAAEVYLLRFGTTGATASVGYVDIAYEFSLNFTKTPTGVGLVALGVDNAFGPPNELCINAITAHQGAFPFGWFYGVDVPELELLSYLTLGVPFCTVLDGSGAASTCFFGLPDLLGVTVYAVGVTFDAFGTKTRQTVASAVAL